VHFSERHSAQPQPHTEADFEAARRLQKKHGTSYYFATCLFPKELRQATFALYAFFRVPDEFVDNPTAADSGRRQLERWRSDWERTYQSGGSGDDPVLRATAHVFQKYQIPYGYSESFLDAMERDLSDDTYEDYAALERYMYGSAAVVGLMMSHVIGFSDPRALAYAEKLGYAMQLTNFLRDIDEDFSARGRVYLPKDELARFGVSRQNIQDRAFDPDFRALMQFQIDRAYRLYEESAAGIALLNPDGRFAVRTASALYREILVKLGQQENNPFLGRARTSTLEKTRLTARIWLKYYGK
jgi:15-cis-phytoene synthase